MNIYERIQILRKNHLKLTQEEFSSKIKISRSNLGSIEIGRISVTDRVINDICLAYGVNENWLRYGKGSMFENNDSITVTQVIEKYKLDNLDKKIIETYVQLPEIQRGVIKGFVRSLVDTVLEDENYEEYRGDYIKENATLTAARNGDTNGLQEAVELFDNLDIDKDN